MRNRRPSSRQIAALALISAIPLAGAVFVTDAGTSASATTPPALSFGPAHLVGGSPGGIGPMTGVRSTNWAGYVDKSHGFTSVSASWAVPKVTCSSDDSVASFWAGIDGYHSKTVEQAGTMGFCHGHTPAYYTWWEMYPSNKVQYVGKSVHVGDHITASVSVSGNNYTLKVTDVQHPANSFTEHATCASCLNASAEWIAERPSHDSGLYPLAKFGDQTFYESHVGSGKESGTIKKYAHDAVTMINRNGATLAQVSDLQRAGNRFIATWVRGQ